MVRQKDLVLASRLSELNDDIASVLPRIHIVKGGKGVLESKDRLVNNWLQVNLVLCEEVAKILLIFCRSDTDAPGMWSV